MESQSSDEMSNDDRDKLVHVVGKKSSTLVPICIMNKLRPIVTLFAHSKVRKIAGVPTNNKYLFASTTSDDHVSGTSEFSDVCDHLNLSKKVNATLIRHYVATKFEESHSLDENEKLVYFKHFGHHKDINENIYKARPIEQEISVAAKIRDVVRGQQKRTMTSPLPGTSRSFSENDFPEVNETVGASTEPKVVKTFSRKRSLFSKPASEDSSDSESDWTQSCVSDSFEDLADVHSSKEGKGPPPSISDQESKYKRWSKDDNKKVREAFKSFIEKDRFNKPSADEMKQFVRDNSFDRIDKEVLNTPSRCNALLRKLYNEHKLYKERVRRIEKEFSSPK